MSFTTKNLQKVHEQLYRYALILTFGNIHKAEDLTQDTIARMWINRDKYLSQYALITWAARIMKRLHIDQGRHDSEEKEKVRSVEDIAKIKFIKEKSYIYPEEVFGTGGIKDIEEKIHEELDVSRITEFFINKLREYRERYADIIECKSKGMSYEAMAIRFNIPIGTVKATINRVHTIMNDKYRQIYEELVKD